MTLFIQAGDEVIQLVDDKLMNQFDELMGIIKTIATMFSSDAQSLCAVAMLLYFAVKSYAMMTGDSKFEILPLLRPFGILLVIMNWGAFISVMEAPFDALEDTAKAKFEAQRKDINKKFLERNVAMNLVLKEAYKKNAELQRATSNEAISWIPGLKEALDGIANAMFYLEQQTKLIFRELIEFIVVAIFKMMLFIVLYAKLLMSGLLMIIGPLSFAASIIPAFRDAYINWISKFVSVMLYGVFGYIAMILAFIHVQWAIQKEIDFLNSISTDPTAIFKWVAGYNAVEGSLIVALLIGALGMICVPVVSHWVLSMGSTNALFSKAANTVKSGASMAAGGVTKMIK